MLKIYVARHGQDEDNAKRILNGHRNSPLTELGKDQARQLAQGAKNAGMLFDSVYSSPLRRAYDTALEVAGAFNLAAPVVLPELIERDFGVMTGREIAEIKTLVPAEHILQTDIITYFLEAEGSEDYPTTLKRAERVLQLITTRHTDGSPLLVCHSDIGKMLFAAYYKKPWREVLALFHFGNSELLELSQNSNPESSHIIRIEQFNH
jgi:broad specificity phosphatase PhoE